MRSRSAISRRAFIADVRNRDIDLLGAVKSASRLCRYKPSLSNRSNRWGQPRQQQAYRVSGDAHMLPAVHDPEVKI